MSFNSNGILLLGFDKLRQDHSLQLWNVEHYSKNGNNDHLTQSSMVSYIPNEAVLSTTFHPQDPNSLLVGSYKFLREYDLRSDQTPVFQLGTRCTSGISVDPFSPFFFASYLEDGTLCIWDRRKLSSTNSLVANGLLSNTSVHETPLLTFNKLLNDSRKGNYSNACFKYSPTRRGEFSTLFNGELIRRWSTGTIPPSAMELTTYETYLLNNNSHNSNNNGNNDTPSNINHLPPPSESLFVVSVNDTKTKYERVVSFDYVPDRHSRLGINFICMRQSGSLYRMSVTESPSALDFSSFNDITFSGANGTVTQLLKDDFELGLLESKPIHRLTSNFRRLSLASQNSTKIRKKDEGPLGADDVSSDDASSILNDSEVSTISDANSEDAEIHVPLTDIFDADQILENDILTTIRRRAMLGYGTDTKKNVPIFEQNLNKDIHLRNTWKWMDITLASGRSNSLVSGNIDFAFEGVLGIWNGSDTFQDQTRSRGPITEKKFEKAIKDIVKYRTELHLESDRDAKKAAQRRFCLYIAGWDFTKEELDQKLELLQSRGLYEKAAGWAVFHGDVPKLVQILADSKRERLRIMSTAIAGYMLYKDIPTNSPWKEQCRRMASELDDPYLRLIFAFIADNDWWDVFDESSLPLREKVGVALRFLSDKDLTVFLNRLAEKVISGGELEGLILTGITPKGMDLLQTYVNRTSDVQTAALLASYGYPRFFKDERLETWIDCYRTLLNSWSLFSVRAKFDVSRTELSKTFNEEVTLKQAPRQVYLQCFRCNKNISKPSTKKQQQDFLFPGQQQKRFNTSHGNGRFPGESSKWDSCSCPHCGAPFPRCAICLLSLGTALPDDVSVPASTEVLGENGKKGAANGGNNLVTNPNNGTGQKRDTDLNKIDKQFREWFSFCLACNHGMHAGHAEEWFSKHYVCAVPDCNCRCNNR